MRRRLLIEWCLITVIAAAVIAGLLVSRITDRVDNVFYDVLSGVRAPAPSSRILIVAIDDVSVAALGRWPWPRAIHARALDRLAAAHPAAIAYDVLFTEAGVPQDDAALARAIAGSGKVALPVLFEMPGLDGRLIDVTPPVAPIGGAARALGEVAFPQDPDGISRSVPLHIEAGDRDWPHLMEETYRIAYGHASPIFERLARRDETRVSIPFQPGSGAFRTLSFSSLAAGEVPASFLKDRIILIGMTATGLGDRFRVPTHTGGLITGVEVQANLLNSLLADRMIIEPGVPVRLLVALAPALILLVAFWWLSPARAFLAALTLISVAFLVPILLLLFADLWLPPTPSLIGLLLIYPLWGWRRLQAVDDAIGQELRAFAEEALVPAAPVVALQDPVGGQTTRLRAAIAEMRDMRRLVADTIDGVDDPMLVTDLEDRVILANNAARRLDRAVESRSAARLLSRLSGQKLLPDALPRELATKRGAIFALRRFPLRGHDNVQRGWILHLADISEVRRAEREREEMLEFLSHDMRSPQSSIITLIEQHRSAIGPDGIAERITTLARKTLTLAENFVQLARFSVASFEPDELNLADVLTEAADDLWPLASRRNVRIIVEEEDEGGFLLGERDTLVRALTNLLDNAVKFSPDGGTILCRVRVVDAHFIECSIEDEGPGMPAERSAALFARFGHHKPAGSSRQSVGLGLAFVKAAVDRHHGEIRCEPRAPHGTRFILRFPGVQEPL